MFDETDNNFDEDIQTAEIDTGLKAFSHKTESQPVRLITNLRDFISDLVLNRPEFLRTGPIHKLIPDLVNDTIECLLSIPTESERSYFLAEILNSLELDSRTLEMVSDPDFECLLSPQQAGTYHKIEFLKELVRQQSTRLIEEMALSFPDKPETTDTLQALYRENINRTLEGIKLENLSFIPAYKPIVMHIEGGTPQEHISSSHQKILFQDEVLPGQEISLGNFEVTRIKDRMALARITNTGSQKCTHMGGFYYNPEREIFGFALSEADPEKIIAPVSTAYNTVKGAVLRIQNMLNESKEMTKESFRKMTFEVEALVQQSFDMHQILNEIAQEKATSRVLKSINHLDLYPDLVQNAPYEVGAATLHSGVFLKNNLFLSQVGNGGMFIIRNHKPVWQSTGYNTEINASVERSLNPNQIHCEQLALRKGDLLVAYTSSILEESEDLPEEVIITRIIELLEQNNTLTEIVKTLLEESIYNYHKAKDTAILAYRV